MNYSQKAKEARLKVLDMIHRAQSSHIASNFSCIDILTVLFDKVDPNKDEIILSAGWKAAAWYYGLNQLGIVSDEELNSYCQEGSRFIGLVEPIDSRFGLKCAGGSMGMGLPFGVGFALAKKIKKEAGTVYVLMSDGEQAIGTTHEAALFAAHHKLDNLVVLVDANGFQAMGKVEEVLKINPIGMFSAAGWATLRGDGHSFEKVEKFLVDGSKEKGLPLVLVFDTVKGKGVSFMENKLEWHYRNILKHEYELAVARLLEVPDES